MTKFNICGCGGIGSFAAEALPAADEARLQRRSGRRLAGGYDEDRAGHRKGIAQRGCRTLSFFI